MQETDFLEQSILQKYYELALEKMSPYACSWEGKRLCEHIKEREGKASSEDYDRALFYIEYAYKCGIERTKEVYDELIRSIRKTN